MTSLGCVGADVFLLPELTEVGYNALRYRHGTATTNIQALTLRNQPVGTDYLFVG